MHGACDWFALWRPARHETILWARRGDYLFQCLLGLPPVVVGLSIYLLLSRNGLFGFLDILYTPLAMMIAQVVLILPIAIALSRQLLESLHQEYDLFSHRLGCHHGGAWLCFCKMPKRACDNYAGLCRAVPYLRWGRLLLSAGISIM